MLTNQDISKLLDQMAAIYEVKDSDFFRTRAYQNASAALEKLTLSARDLWEQGKLDEIPGVGPGIAKHLDELFRLGYSPHWNAEMRRVPQGMFGLLDIRGVGPKIAYKIAKKYHLKDPKTAKKEVKKLIAQGKLASLPGMGEKMQTKIKTSIESEYVMKHRLLLSEVLPIAQRFINYLKTIPEVKFAEPLGSTRRHVATIGDLDLAVCTDKQEVAMEKILKYPEINRVISSGDWVARVQLKTGHEVDIKLSPSDEWGSLLQHYTGSKIHNILLREYALKKHFSLSEHGIKNTKTNRVTKFTDEKSFYEFLKLPYIPVELREDEAEMNLAVKGKLPNVVDLKDIKGDLHIHSDFDYSSSHDVGDSSLKDYLDRARQLGYEYIGITDHNPKYTGLTVKQRKRIIESRKNYLLTQYHEYENKVKRGVPKLLIGLEVDIRPNGGLALEDTLMDLLDYAIVSIHSGFTGTKNDNTKRIISALTHPKALIFGHPTGRILNHRQSIQADWIEIFKFCQKNGKIIEINASPDRLDLPDDLTKIAVQTGNKFVINSDSHNSETMDDMKYGIWAARRGWCTKKDIVNTCKYSDLTRVLKLKD